MLCLSPVFWSLSVRAAGFSQFPAMPGDLSRRAIASKFSVAVNALIAGSYAMPKKIPALTSDNFRPLQQRKLPVFHVFSLARRWHQI
jgi:hypothetical protein